MTSFYDDTRRRRDVNYRAAEQLLLRAQADGRNRLTVEESRQLQGYLDETRALDAEAERRTQADATIRSLTERINGSHARRGATNTAGRLAPLCNRRSSSSGKPGRWQFLPPHHDFAISAWGTSVISDFLRRS